MGQTKAIIYIDMDDVLCEYKVAHEAALMKNPGIKYPQSQYGFFEGLRPKPGAVESVEALYNNPKYEVYILTAPSTLNPLSYTEKRIWVEKNLGMELVDRLIISANKGLMKGDFLIDDCVEGFGQEYFEGEVLHFGSASYPNWESVMERFK